MVLMTLIMYTVRMLSVYIERMAIQEQMGIIFASYKAVNFENEWKEINFHGYIAIIWLDSVDYYKLLEMLIEE